MPNIPRPNTYIKIKDIEQLKLLCEYKNDEVRPDEEFDLNENIKDFEDGYIYFKWNNDGDGYNTDKYGIDGTYTKLTDDSFLYPNKKPMDNFIITGIDDSNREKVLNKLKREYGLEYDEKSSGAIEIRIDKNDHSVWNFTTEGRGWYKCYPEYKDWTFITASEFLDKQTKPKKEKQEIFDNQFKVGQKVFVLEKDTIVECKIYAIQYQKYSLEKEHDIYYPENQLYKTKSQLIKSLSKQWRQEVEERILSLTK